MATKKTNECLPCGVFRFCELEIDAVFYIVSSPEETWRKVSNTEAIPENSNYSSATRRRVGTATKVRCDWDK